MAVDPAPATTSTVTIGPSCVTAARAAPAPETSAAPNSTSRTLMVKMMRTVSGIATAMVGRNVTRNWNQLWITNSRNSNGHLVVAFAVSTHMRKKPPTAVSGAPSLSWT